MPKTILETPRLRLQELGDADAGFLTELLNTDGFLRHIGDRGVRTPADALRYLAEGPYASYAANGFGLWKAVRKADGRAVGMSGLVKRDTLPHPDLGYAFLPQHSGQGLASEAGAAVLAHGFETLGLARILAIVTPHNTGSRRVLEKLGLRHLGDQAFDAETLRVYGIDRPGTLAWNRQ